MIHQIKIPKFQDGGPDNPIRRSYTASDNSSRQDNTNYVTTKQVYTSPISGKQRVFTDTAKNRPREYQQASMSQSTPKQLENERFNNYSKDYYDNLPSGKLINAANQSTEWLDNNLDIPIVKQMNPLTMVTRGLGNIGESAQNLEKGNYLNALGNYAMAGMDLTAAGGLGKGVLAAGENSALLNTRIALDKSRAMSAPFPTFKIYQKEIDNARKEFFDLTTSKEGMSRLKLADKEGYGDKLYNAGLRLKREGIDSYMPYRLDDEIASAGQSYPFASDFGVKYKGKSFPNMLPQEISDVEKRLIQSPRLQHNIRFEAKYNPLLDNDPYNTAFHESGHQLFGLPRQGAKFDELQKLISVNNDPYFSAVDELGAYPIEMSSSANKLINKEYFSPWTKEHVNNLREALPEDSPLKMFMNENNVTHPEFLRYKNILPFADGGKIPHNGMVIKNRTTQYDFNNNYNDYYIKNDQARDTKMFGMYADMMDQNRRNGIEDHEGVIKYMSQSYGQRSRGLDNEVGFGFDAEQLRPDEMLEQYNYLLYGDKENENKVRLNNDLHVAEQFAKKHGLKNYKLIR